MASASPARAASFGPPSSSTATCRPRSSRPCAAPCSITRRRKTSRSLRRKCTTWSARSPPTRRCARSTSIRAPPTPSSTTRDRRSTRKRRRRKPGPGPSPSWTNISWRIIPASAPFLTPNASGEERRPTMTCPQCGLDMTPGKVCVNCGYDSSRPGASPSDKPGIPITPKEDDAYSTRDVGQAVPVRKAPKSKSKGKAAAPRGSIPVPDDFLERIDRPAAPAPPLSLPSSETQVTVQRSKAQQASIPVTTQVAFEGQRIITYAGVVTGSVVVRIGETDDLLPLGQDMQSLSSGPIGTQLRKAIDLALADLKTHAIERGGNGVVGVRLEVLPTQGPLATVTMIGTAVVLE